MDLLNGCPVVAPVDESHGRREHPKVGADQPACGRTLAGLGLTGGVITAAGVVLAGTFAALAQLPSVSLTEVGTAVAIGVLLDTLVVRTILVPATFFTIDERAWWPRQPPQEATRANTPFANPHPPTNRIL